jgi:hypothetical protein
VRRCSSLDYILEKKQRVVMVDSIITKLVNAIKTGDMNVCIVRANIEDVTGRADKVMGSGSGFSSCARVHQKRTTVRRLSLIGQIML